MRSIIRYHQLPRTMEEIVLNDILGSRSDAKINCNCPQANVTETETDFSLQLAVPGYDNNELNITIEDNVLSISAEIDAEKNEERSFLRKEFRKTSFKRSFELPALSETEKIQASNSNGILTVVIPKKAKVIIPVQEIDVK